MENGKWKMENDGNIVRRILFAFRSFSRQKCSTFGKITEMPHHSRLATFNSRQEGMTLLVIMAMMVLLAIALLAIAPSIQQSVQREKELESIRRGEEIAEAIRQYVDFYKGAKLPDSMDELLEGLPNGTKKRQILRPSAAIDPLSEDGQWRLIGPTDKAFLNFGKRVLTYNNGLLPPVGNQYLNRYAVGFANVIDTKNEEDLIGVDEAEYEVKTSNAPFIAVASQSKSRSVLTYYGIENHSKWIFTPLFRGTGGTQNNKQGQGQGDPPPPPPPPSDINP